MSIIVSNGDGVITVDYGTGRVETLQKGSFRTVIKEPTLYLVFSNVDNLFPKYSYGDDHSLMKDKIELNYTEVSEPASASAEALRDTILGWDAVPPPISARSFESGEIEELISVPTGFAGTAALQTADFGVIATMLTGDQRTIIVDTDERTARIGGSGQLYVTQYLSDGTEGNKIVDEETGKSANVESLGSLKTITPIRLAGTSFSGMTKDPNFWTETLTIAGVENVGSSGTVTQAGEVTLATGTTANSGAIYQSVRKARKVTGTANQFRAVARNVQEPAANCIRRIGCYDANNGFFFQYDGVTFGVGSRKGGVDTVVNNGSFNGNEGSEITANFTTFARLIIEYTSLGAKFFVNGALIHTISATNSALCQTLDLKITIEIENEGDSTTNNSYEVLFATILRLGEIVTAPKTYHLSGNAATHILKYGAGVLQKIMFNNTSGTSITIYDNTAASGTVIGIITTASAALGEWEYNAPFDNGLTLVTVGNSLDASIIYE